MSAAAPRAGAAWRPARLALVVAIAGLTICAWWWLWPMNMMPMSVPDGMPAESLPWVPEQALSLFVMWSVMMAAMMVPTAAPMIAAVERSAHGGGAHGPRWITSAFVLGYAAMWTAFGAAATAAQWALEQAGLMSPMMASANRWLTAGLLLGAGAFQFTPLKDACLRRCRSPMAFLVTEWRRGIAGSFRGGLRHGLHCLGCCFGLMLLLFVFGTMNLAAALGLAALVLAEKVMPGGVWIARVTGLALIAWGAWLLLPAAA